MKSGGRVSFIFVYCFFRFDRGRGAEESFESNLRLIFENEESIEF